MSTAVLNVGRSTGRISLAALLMAFASDAASGQTVSLQPKFKVGDEHVYKTTFNSSMSGPISQTQSMSSVVRQRVVSVAADGSAVVNVTTESMRMVMDGPMGSFEYDSQTGTMPTGPFAAVASTLAARVGQSREMKVSKDGAMNVEGIEGVSFSGDLMSFPSEPVRVGAEWDRESTVNMAPGAGMSASLKASTRYRLKEIATRDGRQVAVIELTMKGVLQNDPSSAAGSVLGDLPIESTGEMIYDIERGLMIRTVQRQTATMNLMGESMQTISDTVTEIVP